MIVAKADFEMDNLGAHPRTDKIVEPLFLLFYVLELLLKFAVHRWFYFCNKVV